MNTFQSKWEQMALISDPEGAEEARKIFYAGGIAMKGLLKGILTDPALSDDTKALMLDNIDAETTAFLKEALSEAILNNPQRVIDEIVKEFDRNRKAPDNAGATN